MNALVQQYQSHVLTPTEGVDYAAIIRQNYPPDVISLSSLVGFKVRCRDTQARMSNPRDRLRYLDSNLGILRDKGCLIRETEPTIPDGFYVMTLPVKTSHLNSALNNLFDVLASLRHYFGIITDGFVEINVSGRCPGNALEYCLSHLNIPSTYMSRLIVVPNVMCSIGTIQRINPEFICLRTRWNFPQAELSPKSFDDMLIIAQSITSMYNI